MKFKIEDIKAGYLLKVKDTKHEDPYYMSVIPNDFDELGCCCTEPREYCPLDCFDEKWRYEVFGRKLTIEAVYGRAHNRDLLSNKPNGRPLLWERQTVKKMTLSDICKELGYDVEIIKEKEND